MDELIWRVISLGALLIVAFAWLVHGLSRIQWRKTRWQRFKELEQERAADDSRSPSHAPHSIPA